MTVQTVTIIATLSVVVASLCTVVAVLWVLLHAWRSSYRELLLRVGQPEPKAADGMYSMTFEPSSASAPASAPASAVAAEPKKRVQPASWTQIAAELEAEAEAGR